MRNASQRRAAAEFYRINMGPIELADVSESAWPKIQEQMVRLGVVSQPQQPRPRRLPTLTIPQ